MTFQVLVTVGTDHHPFDRLVQWADRWARRHPEATVVVQHGHAAPPTDAAGHPLLHHTELDALMRDSDVVVTHGGPATVTQARAHGHVPVAVARDPQRGEHVDDHQQRFVRFLAGRGLVVQVDDEQAFDTVLDEARADPGRLRLPEARADDDLPSGILETGRIIASLVAQHRGSPTPGKAQESPPVMPAPAAEPSTSCTVLYIGGQGRSGSTLIERAAAELPGAVGVGEVLHLWRRGLRNGELCGCGEPFRSCPFWCKVGDVAFGGWDALDADEMVRLRYAVDRNRYVPFMLRPGLNRRYDAQRRRYAQALGRLYSAIAEVSGASVIVDSSKHASYALLLRDVPGIDLRLLHVVRDSPAVAHAWAKEVVRPETDGELMPTYGPVEASVLWDTQNLLLDLLARRHRHVTVRYEDFVADPAGQLARVADLVADRTGVPGRRQWDFLDDHTLHLGPSHSVAGNPMRFQDGDVTVQLDDRWRSAMPSSSRRLVAALPAPVRARHGYLRGAS